MTLTLSEYATGIAYLAVTLGASAVACEVVVRRRLGHLAGIPRVLAFATLLTAVLFAVHLLPAMLGVLGRPEVAITAVLALGASLVVPGVPGRSMPSWPEALHRDQPLSRALALAACAALAAYLAAVVLALADDPPTNVDTLTFHLPNVARWIQSGSIWQIDQFIPDQAHGYYPNTGDMLELAAVLPWRSDFTIRLLALPFVAVTALATYGIGRELRAPASSAALATALVISVPAVTIYAVEKPLPDAVTLAGFATGALFLLRHQRLGAGADLAVAAVALGIAFGSKWYGVSSVIALLLVWAVARLLARQPWRVVARQALLVLSGVLVVGGVWLVRNWIESGNPVFPVDVSVLGVTVFDAPTDLIRQLYGHTISDYAFDPGVWGDFILPGYADFLGLPAALLAIGLVISVPLARSVRNRGPFLAVASAALVMAVVYGFTPYTALGTDGMPGGVGVNSRYLVPALLLAAGPCAFLLCAGGRLRHPLEVLALIAVLDGLRRATPISVAPLLAGAIVLGLIVGAWVLLRRRPRAVVPAVAAALVVAVGLGYALQRRYNDDRYRQEPVLGRFATDLSSGHKVGLAGFWDLDHPQPILPAFGSRFENRVEYAGRFENGMLRPLERRADFERELNDERFDLLLIGGRPLPTRDDQPELEWAMDAGYRVIATDARFALLARPG